MVTLSYLVLFYPVGGYSSLPGFHQDSNTEQFPENLPRKWGYNGDITENLPREVPAGDFMGKYHYKSKISGDSGDIIVIYFSTDNMV